MITCPYKPCGSNQNCIGCINDPEKRIMSSEMFWDMNCHLGCGDCKHCDCKADLDRVESRCKRIDHKQIQFAKPYFKSYDCGQRSSILCSDFEPKEWELWLYRHWKREFLGAVNTDGYIGLCLNKDQSVRYFVTKEDFFYGTFLNEDGSLKWKKKMYYKQSRKSPIGYELITEWNKEDN